MNSDHINLFISFQLEAKADNRVIVNTADSEKVKPPPTNNAVSSPTHISRPQEEGPEPVGHFVDR